MTLLVTELPRPTPRFDPNDEGQFRLAVQQMFRRIAPGGYADAPQVLQDLNAERMAWAQGPEGYGGLREAFQELPRGANRRLSRFLSNPRVMKAWGDAASVGAVGPLPQANAMSFETIQGLKERLDALTEAAFAKRDGDLGRRLAAAQRPMLIGCRFQANSRAAYNVEVVNVNRPYLHGYGISSNTADVGLTQATSRAVILGLSCADPTGSALWLGAADGLLRFQGYGGSIRTTSTSGTVLISDRTLVIDDSGANKTMTLIAAASCKNQILTFIKGSASNKTTVDGNGSETIDGMTTYVLRKQYEWVTIQSDGTAWYVLGAGLFPGSIVTASSTPADPTGTTSTAAFKMMGLAGSVTPKRSGTLWVSISGQMANSGAGDGVSVQLRMGTGSAPANADAVTGTQYGATQRSGFCIALPVTGLTVDTAYWIDAAVEAVTAGTAAITGITIGAVEL